MHIEILNIAQIPQVGIHIELIEFLRGEASFVDADPIDEIRNEFFVSTDALVEAMKYFDGDEPKESQAKELYHLTEPFSYIMFIN